MPCDITVWIILLKFFFIKFGKDKSVLENHHIASSWLITIQDEKSDIFGKLDPDTYKLIRQRMISMVLATDMSSHFGDLAKTKAKVSSSELDLKDKDKYSCMDNLIHAADISNPLKPFPVYYQWTERVLSEYWNQVKNFLLLRNFSFHLFFIWSYDV